MRAGGNQHHDAESVTEPRAIATGSFIIFHNLSFDIFHLPFGHEQLPSSCRGFVNGEVLDINLEDYH